MGNKVLLAWRRTSGGLYYMITALGDLTIVDIEGQDFPVINWTRVSTFTLSETDYNDFPGSDPSVTHDNDRFYLAFVRKSKASAGGQSHASLFVYSTDGTSWNRYTSLGDPEGGFPLGATVTVTAYSSGQLLAAAVGSSPDHLGVYRYSGSSWTKLDANSVFHWTPRTLTGLSLITTIRE